MYWAAGFVSKTYASLIWFVQFENKQVARRAPPRLDFLVTHFKKNVFGKHHHSAVQYSVKLRHFILKWYWHFLCVHFIKNSMVVPSVFVCVAGFLKGKQFNCMYLTAALKNNIMKSSQKITSVNWMYVSHDLLYHHLWAMLTYPNRSLNKYKSGWLKFVFLRFLLAGQKRVSVVSQPRSQWLLSKALKKSHCWLSSLEFDFPNFTGQST